MDIDAIGLHAIGEWESLISVITYTAVSRINSGQANGQRENSLADVYIWDDGVPILWDDGLYITIYG